MDQIKIGVFLRGLRREKGLTQEQLAERFGVSARTVSRWETGSNMPDLSVLVEIADFYEVELREILDGERTIKKMDKELKETVIKVAEYSNTEKTKLARGTLLYLSAGIAALIANGVLNFLELESTFWVGFAEGATFGLALCALVFGILYITGSLARVTAVKKKLLKR